MPLCLVEKINNDIDDVYHQDFRLLFVRTFQKSEGEEYDP
jgi:hypothetical protein